MKAKIFHMLAATEKPLSGTDLSRVLGVSRVAVWKHIQQIKAAGGAIETTAKGYRLVRPPDRPFAWVFGPRAGRIHYFDELASTMNEAMSMAGAGCPAFTVVVAERQSAGRGRLRRPWESAAGGLYFSHVLRPDLDPSKAPLINLAVAVDLAEVLIEYYGIEARVKWPNDLLVQGRKIAGILAQMRAEADRIEFVNVGIGLNVNNPVVDISQPATSVALATGKPALRSQLLEQYLDRFEKRVENEAWSDVVAQWRRLSTTFGRCVTISAGAEQMVGTALDIEENGGLVIETANGERHTVLYGDCLHGNSQAAPPAD